MAVDYIFPAITSASAGYLSSNISKTTSQQGDSSTHFNANAIILNNSPSKFYVLRNINDQKHYAFFGGSFSSNTSTSNLLDTAQNAYSLFQSDKAGWTNFYNDFHIPVPNLVSNINSSVALAFPIENGYLRLDNPTYTATLNSTGKLDSTLWESNNLAFPDYYVSIPYDISWFGMTECEDCPDPVPCDYTIISNAIYSLGAVIIVVCFFSMIYKIFHRLRG